MRPDRLRGDWLGEHLYPARVLLYARLGSTQQRAMEEVEAGRLSAPAVVVAARQTAGRGQRANRWWSDAGSLCASYVLPASSHPAGQVPLRAGLAVAEVLARHLPGGRVRVKWPNDVLVEGRKIAGVLCARLRGCDVIGIGLNVRTATRRMPREFRRGATSLHLAATRAPPRAVLLVELWEAIRDQLARADVEEAYARRSHTQGKPVRVRVGPTIRAGVCRGVDRDGRLCVDSGGTLLRLTDSEQLIR